MEPLPLVRTRGSVTPPSRDKAAGGKREPSARAKMPPLVASEDGAGKVRIKTLTRGLQAL